MSPESRMFGGTTAATRASAAWGAAATVAEGVEEAAGAVGAAAPAGAAVACSSRSRRADNAAISARIAAISVLLLGWARTGAVSANEAATRPAARLFRIDFAPVFVWRRRDGHNATVPLQSCYKRS